MTGDACRLLLVHALLLMNACEGPSAAPDTAAEAPVAATHQEPQHAAGETVEAHEALALRPIMQQLANNLAGFSYALWLEDYEEMTARAAAIAEHPHISPQEIQRIERKPGTEMASFEAADEALHLASVRPHEGRRGEAA